jgi:hypothetical protein
MSIRAWIATLALLLPLTATAGGSQTVYEMEARGEIEIGPGGAVHDYRLNSDLTPEIAEIVGNKVRTWEFEPVLIDGKPVIAKTMMRLQLSAVPTDDDRYALQVKNVWFGEPQRSGRITPPDYPMDAVYKGLGAKVVLVLRLDADGKVVDVLPEQISLTSEGSERDVNRFRTLFERASIKAAKRWKFDMTEQIGGRPIGSMVRIPVTYTLSDGPRPQTDGKWNGFVPGPIRPIPWVTLETVASQAERDRLTDGDVQSLGSRFKLKEEIVGKTL